MTTPAMSYYDNIIKSNKKMKKEYRHHKWKWFYSSKIITSFVYKGFGSNIFHYTKGYLTLEKDKPNSYWNAPDEYFLPIKISLSKEQNKRLKMILKRIWFNKKTDPRSFVNLYGGYMVREHFSCHIAYIFKYSFVPISRHDDIYFQELSRFLNVAFENLPEYKSLKSLEKRIFEQEEFVNKQ